MDVKCKGALKSGLGCFLGCSPGKCVLRIRNTRREKIISSQNTVSDIREKSNTSAREQHAPGRGFGKLWGQ